MASMDSTTGSEISVFVLDGGFSTQLARHVGTTADGDPLWSARFLQTHPEDIVKTHLDFLRAGSDIIMTNTYQASVDGFVNHLGVTPDEGYALILRAVSLAKHARDTFLQESEGNSPNKKLLVVGSVGPYGAHLNDGSEYSGSYADKTLMETMREWHTPRINALVEAGVDLLAFETIPCQKEAEVLVQMLKEYPNMKAWLSLSCKDETSLVHGENFQRVARKCYDMNPDQLVAIGTNCCSPLIVADLFRGINEDRSHPIPLLTYPNSGEKYTPELGWVDKHKHLRLLDSFVSEWLDIGVRYLGGCCRTVAEDIARIRKEVYMWLDDKK